MELKVRDSKNIRSMFPEINIAICRNYSNQTKLRNIMSSKVCSEYCINKYINKADIENGKSKTSFIVGLKIKTKINYTEY